MENMDTSDLLTMSLDDIMKQKKESNQVDKSRPRQRPNNALNRRTRKRSPLLRKIRRSRPFDKMEGRSDAVNKWEHDRHEAYEMEMDVDPALRRENRKLGRRRLNKSGTGSGKGSILSRLGSTPSSKVFGVQVSFGNLNQDVDIDDIKEVAATIGQVNHVDLMKNRNGRSTGKALVTYARFLDAKQAVENLNMRTLDGTPMQVEMIGPVGGARGVDLENSEFKIQPRPMKMKSDIPLSKFSAMALEREGALKPSTSIMKGRGFQPSDQRNEVRDDFYKNKMARKQRNRNKMVA